MEDQKRYQNNRHRGPRGRGPRHGHRSGGRGQRPLLTSSTNASGLCLVALAISLGAETTNLPFFSGALALATIAFATSALVSYFAQRTSKKWVEKISDVFFFFGLLDVIYIAGGLGGLWASALMI